MSESLPPTRIAPEGRDGDPPNATDPVVRPERVARIGHYRILRKIGEGGMGRVYEAEQENPRRVVALKVIRAGFATPSRAKRFEHEAQTLGRLHHPGIAQIYEAGSVPTDEGSEPFFAMELVRGVSLTDYVARHALSMHARLELFVEICAAVQHAHENGVIHRDLKPANILVDEHGRPKILDFGLARLIDSDVQAVTMQTDVGQLLGTLPYMSPEQVAADPHGIDTRSDVYALGVILYEMLSGQLPHDVRTKVLHEAVRTIREEDPPPLSSIVREYRGDIENIVSRALEKERDRRYASAADLATDIGRFLRHEPIVARRPSAIYQLRKFAQRNRVLVVGIASVFVVLVIGAVASALFALEARDAERRVNEQLVATQSAEKLARAREAEAHVEAAKAKAISAFLTDMLQAADPGNSRDREVKVRDVLDDAAKQVDQGSLADQPEVEIAVRRTLGTTYAAIGELASAEKHLRKALELATSRSIDVARSSGELVLSSTDRSDHSPNAGDHSRSSSDASLTSGDLALCSYELAVVIDDRGAYTEALPLAEKALEMHVSALGENSVEVSDDRILLGSLYYNLDRREESLAENRRAVAIRKAVFGERHPHVAVALTTLAFHLYEQRDYAAAQPLLDEAVDILSAAGKDSELKLAEVLKQRGRLYDAKGEHANAEKDLDGALEILEKTYGSDHFRVADILDAQASMYMSTGNLERAEPLEVEALAIRRKLFGDHRDTATSLTTLAAIANLKGDVDGALAMAREALAMRRKVLGDGNAAVGDSELRIGNLLAKKGALDEAEKSLRQSIAIFEKTLGPDHPDLARPMLSLARILRKKNELEEAETLLRKCVDVQGARKGELASEATEARDDLVQVLLQRKKWNDAEKLLSEMLPKYEASLGASSPLVAFTRIQLGAALTGQARFGEAEALMVESAKGVIANPTLWAESKVLAASWVADLYAAWKKPDDEKKWREEAAKWKKP
jgi:tetratricopeptide (TPR) repeat protein